jgi:hypothetical protein
LLTSSFCRYVKLDYRYNGHEWHGEIFDFSVEVVEYTCVISKYFVALEIYFREYYCDMVKIYCKIFVPTHAHKLTPIGLQNNIPPKFMRCQNAILAQQFKHAHCMWVTKCNIHIMTLNPHYLWEVKMQNSYVKHKTFLMEFHEHVKSI